MSNFEDVAAFHEKFGLRTDTDPQLLNDSTMLYRAQFMLEELHETMKAHAKQDLAGVADGLVDLVYVALGTAYLMGLPFDELFAEVQRANMEKVRASSAAESKRGSSLDVVKPAGWRGPDLETVLARYTHQP